MLRGLKFHFDNEYVSEPVHYGPVLLWQIGDIGCDPGYLVKDHEQYCYEITCVVGGCGTISSGGAEYPIRKGQLYLNRPGEIHRIRSDLMDPIRYFYLGFDFDRAHMNPMWTAIKTSFDACEHPLVEDLFDINASFSAAFNEMMIKDDVAQELIRGSIYQILLQSHRAFNRKKPQRYISGLSTEQASQLVYSIINYIDANVCAIEYLHDISNQVGYSYTYISPPFHQGRGQIPAGVLQRKTLRQGGQPAQDGDAEQGYREPAEIQNAEQFQQSLQQSFRHVSLRVSGYAQKAGSRGAYE